MYESQEIKITATAMPTTRLHTVLYVDDEPDICAVVGRTLKVIGHLTVHIASSGSQALEVVNQVNPDLVLMDVMMPELDGPSTLNRLRAMDRSPPIPVIFMTAKVLPAEVAHWLRLGVLGVIRKPFNPLTLCDDLLAIWRSAHPAGGDHRAPGDPREVLAQTSSLSAAFLQRTARDVVVLQRWMELGHVGDRSKFPEIERLTHSMSGAGAMFGFPGLSSAAAELEHLVRGAAALGDAHPSDGECALFGRLRERVADLASKAVEAGCIMVDRHLVFQPV